MSVFKYQYHTAVIIVALWEELKSGIISLKLYSFSFFDQNCFEFYFEFLCIHFRIFFCFPTKILLGVGLGLYILNYKWGWIESELAFSNQIYILEGSLFCQFKSELEESRIEVRAVCQSLSHR